VIEDTDEISTLLHKQDSYSIQVITEAMSLAFLKSPGENNVDIALGEAQSFGLPLGFGGPYLGFLTAKQEFLRQMPGRIVGETVDTRGRRGYVLTLSTREQHIKREKATSNICTNQAWCALRAAMYLATMGKSGMEKIGKINHLNTANFVKSISGFNHVNIRYKKNFYNEVVLDIKNMSASDFLNKMKKKQIIAGIPLKWFYPEFQNSLLINFTENHKTGDIDHLVNSIRELQ
jgi:glycine dehydrogenase subunit 1